MAEGEIYAIGCRDNYPYEYINNEGLPAGFSVELIQEIAREMKVNCRVELLPYERFLSLKKNKKADLILGVIRGDSEKDYPFFKTNIKIHFSIFTNSDSGISTINDLQNVKLMIAANDYISHPLMNELKKFLKFTPGFSVDEINAFTLLKRNECDAVFMSGISARKIVENRNLIGIKEIPVSIGFFDYGFGIRGNKNGIKNMLNEGYKRLFSDGRYNNIYNRWFMEKSENRFFSETGIYVSTGIFCLIIFIFFMIINSFILRRRIKEKTEELHLSMNELNKVQVQLKESERRFRRIFNKSPSGLMILNSSGRVILFNEAIVKIFGVTDPHEISDLDVINSPLSTEWFKARLKNYHKINLEMKFDFGIIRETGYFNTYKSGMIILELIIIPVEIESGGPEQGYICQFSDNTNEKKLIEEIKNKQQRLELIFEAVKDGLWEWNLVTGKVRYNRKFFSFLGYKMESYSDDINTLLSFIHDGDRESVKKELFEKVENGRSFNIEYRMMMSNGRIINVRSRGETVEWDADLKPMRVIGIQTEITFQRDIYKRINLFKNFSGKSECRKSEGCNDNILNNKTFLIADDNYLIFLHISEFLKKFKVNCIYAASGNEAVDIFAQRDDICLVILDHNMPGLDGVSVLNEIRKIKNSMPVILQTGQLNDPYDNRFSREGFSGVLGKPVEENLLIETVTGILGSDFYKKI